MGTMRPREAVTAFNECINTAELDQLGALMTDDHTFIDTAGLTVAGKAACVDAWRGFFHAYPDYRNRFESYVENDDAVTVIGRSECSEPVLEGPALWHATVREGLVATWTVHEDTPENRALLGC